MAKDGISTEIEFLVRYLIAFMDEIFVFLSSSSEDDISKSSLGI
jgi:hypothetical protein